MVGDQKGYYLLINLQDRRDSNMARKEPDKFSICIE
jgi:hypothetical protein